MRFRALLDVDGVLADFPRAALRWLNSRRLGRTFEVEQIVEHDILKSFGLEHLQREFDRWCVDTDMCRHLDVYEGAQDFIERLREFADVVIVTSSFEEVRGWESSRRAWLKEHFGISKKDVVFASRKELVPGNLFIDDKLKNVDPWVSAWGHQGTGVVFDRPWNQGTQFRVNSYRGALQVARDVDDAISARRA